MYLIFFLSLSLSIYTFSFDYRKGGIPSVLWFEVQWRKVTVCGLLWCFHRQCLPPICTRFCLQDGRKRKYEFLNIKVKVLLLLFCHFKRHSRWIRILVVLHHYIWGYLVETSVFMHILGDIVLWSCSKHFWWLSYTVSM